MAKKGRDGYLALSKPARKAVREFRESIPKTLAQVAADASRPDGTPGTINERTVLNFEQGQAVTLRKAKKISEGLGVPFDRLRALARGEIKSLIYKPNDNAGYLEFSFRVGGDFSAAKKEELLKLIANIKELVPIVFPHSDPRFSNGSILITFMLHKKDVERACQAFLHGHLERLGVREIRIRCVPRKLNVLSVFLQPYNLSMIPEITEQVASTLEEAHLLSLNRSLDAIVIRTDALHAITQLQQSDHPLWLDSLRSRGVKVLIVSHSPPRLVHYLYGSFPYLSEQEDIVSNIREWATSYHAYMVPMQLDRSENSPQLPNP